MADEPQGEGGQAGAMSDYDELVNLLGLAVDWVKGGNSVELLPQRLADLLRANPEVVLRALGATKNVMELPHEGKHVWWFLSVREDT